MFALPVVAVVGAETRVEDGALFSLPPELTSIAQLNFYKSHAKIGWNVCPQGYHVFVFQDDDGRKFAIPGLALEGQRNSKKNFYKPIILSKTQIEAFAQSLKSEAQRVASARDQELSLLAHDLRALSSAIYNATEESRTALERGNTSLASSRIETVIATHTMLSIRIDMLDVLANQVTYATADKIPIYKKVDKVVRCFRPKASARSISIQIDVQRPHYTYTFGPAIFELIIYAIVDNAVKYSPNNGLITLSIEDSPSQETVISIKSEGPFISAREKLSIFERGFRGQEAIRTGHSGAGIGLSTAKMLAEEFFGGVVTVTQGSVPRQQGSQTFYPTKFEIIVPQYIS